MHDLFPTPWLVNTLLDDGFIAQQRSAWGQAGVPYGLTDWLAQHFTEGADGTWVNTVPFEGEA